MRDEWESKMIFTLGWPDRALSPNAKHTSWTARKDAKSAAYSEGFYAAMPFRGCVHPGPLRLRVTFYCPDRRRRDLDNMLSTLKPHLDGFSAALGIDDSRFDSIVLERGERRDQGAVLIELMQIWVQAGTKG